MMVIDVLVAVVECGVEVRVGRRRRAGEWCWRRYWRIEHGCGCRTRLAQVEMQERGQAKPVWPSWPTEMRSAASACRPQALVALGGNQRRGAHTATPISLLLQSALAEKREWWPRVEAGDGRRVGSRRVRRGKAKS